MLIPRVFLNELRIVCQIARKTPPDSGGVFVCYTPFLLPYQLLYPRLNDLPSVSDGGILLFHKERTGVDGFGCGSGVDPFAVRVDVPVVDVFRSRQNEERLRRRVFPQEEDFSFGNRRGVDLSDDRFGIVLQQEEPVVFFVFRLERGVARKDDRDAGDGQSQNHRPHDDGGQGFPRFFRECRGNSAAVFEHASIIRRNSRIATVRPFPRERALV